MRHNFSSPLVVCLALATSATAADAVPNRLEGFAVDFAAATLRATAAELRPGQRLELTGLALPGAGTVSLDLTRIDIFGADTEIVVHSDGGDRHLAPPATTYLVGGIMFEPASLALVIIRDDGRVSGLVDLHGTLYGLSPAGATPLDRAADEAAAAAPWTCGAGDLARRPPVLDRHSLAAPAALSATNTQYEVQLGIETDFEYYQLFGNTTDATDYVGDLVAGAAAVYLRDVKATLVVSHLSLWDTASDPWAMTDTYCGLLEFGTYWRDNNDAIDRDLAHFVSGKSSNAGIAWLGVLCGGHFSASLNGCSLPSPQYGGPYGYSAGIDGNFDPTSPASPLVWDIVAFTHELGHNFNSPHTHCYDDIPNNGDPPVDECYNAQSGCFSGTETSPPDGGSLMSYCHLRGRGLGNLNLWLGRAGFYGVNSERVTDRIRDEIEREAACLDEFCDATIVAGASASQVCEGTSVDLSGAGSSFASCLGTVDYRWRAGMTTVRDWGPSTDASDTPVASTDYFLDVRCSDPSCIKESSPISVAVAAPLSVDAGPAGGRCPGQPAVSLGGAPTVSGGSGGGTTIAWAAAPPDPTMSCTDCANPTASPAVTTTYTVTVTDPLCGAEMAATTVTLHAPPTADAGADQVIACGTGPVNLGGAPTASGGLGPYTFAWSSVPVDPTLSCTDCANPTASPAVATQYTVLVRDLNGCEVAAGAQVDVQPTALPPLVGNNLHMLKATRAAPPSTDDILARWQAAGGTAASYNLYRFDGLAETAIASQPDPPAETRLTGEAALPGSLFTYRVAAVNCSSAERINLEASVNWMPRDEMCNNTAVELDGILAGGSGPYTYSWDLEGDGRFDVIGLTSPRVTRTYTRVGSYDAVLRASGERTLHATAEVDVGPIVRAMANGGDETATTVGQPVELDGALSGGMSTQPYTYSWDLNGDGTFDLVGLPSPRLTRTYTVAGVFDAALRAEGPCTEEDSVRITVAP